MKALLGILVGTVLVLSACGSSKSGSPATTAPSSAGANRTVSRDDRQRARAFAVDVDERRRRVRVLVRSEA